MAVKGMALPHNVDHCLVCREEEARAESEKVKGKGRTKAEGVCARMRRGMCAVMNVW